MPPKPVGIWATFSCRNRGKAAPSPMPRAAIPKVIRKTVTAESAIMKDVTLRSVFESTLRGRTLLQNLAQRNSRREKGEERMIQKDSPSRLTAGKTKRTATAEVTNPTMPRFRKEIRFWRKKLGMAARSSGRSVKDRK